MKNSQLFLDALAGKAASILQNPDDETIRPDLERQGTDIYSRLFLLQAYVQGFRNEG